MDLKNILVVSDYSDYHSVRPEAEIFLSLARLGHKITVITKAGSRYAKIFLQHNIKVIDQHPTSKYDRKSIGVIRATIARSRPDVVHLFNNKALTNGLIAAKGHPANVIGYRGSTLNFSPFNAFNYFKHLSPRLDYVICNSHGVASRYKNHPFFSSSKAIVINKGHDLAWYSDVKARPLRSEYGIPRHSIIFTLVATDRTMKGVRYLCEAINKLPAECDFRLFMIGAGMDNPKYTKLLQAGVHAHKVVQLSHTDHALTYVAASDVFVLPSIKGESITKAVLEAMSLGCCPLITDIVGNQELVTDQHNGLVVPAGDSIAMASAMQQLIQYEDKRRSYGKRSQERIRTSLSHSSTVAGYLSLYDKL